MAVWASGIVALPSLAHIHAYASFLRVFGDLVELFGREVLTFFCTVRVYILFLFLCWWRSGVFCSFAVFYNSNRASRSCISPGVTWTLWAWASCFWVWAWAWTSSWAWARIRTNCCCLLFLGCLAILAFAVANFSVARATWTIWAIWAWAWATRARTTWTWTWAWAWATRARTTWSFCSVWLGWAV